MLAQLRSAEPLEHWGGGTPGGHPQRRSPFQPLSIPCSPWVGQGQLPGHTPSRLSGRERPPCPEPSPRGQRGQKRSPPGAAYL